MVKEKHWLYKTNVIMSSEAQSIYGTKIRKTIAYKQVESKLFSLSRKMIKMIFNIEL